MSYRNFYAAVLVTFAFTPLAQAQTPRATPAAPARTTTAAKPAAPQTPQARALAVVNNQQITLADIDPQIRTTIENIDKDIAEVRRRALDMQIGRILLEAEAKKRNLTVDQLVKADLSGKVIDPTEAEIKSVYDANRNYFGAADLEQARPLIKQQLRNNRGQQLLDEYIAGLKKTYPVVMGTDVNAPNVAPGAVVATVAGRTINASAVNDDISVKRLISDIRMQTYEAETLAVNVRINQILLEAEAKRRNMTTDALLKAEIADKITQHPTDADVTKFYEANKAQMNGAELATVRADIIAYLEGPERQKLEVAFAERLRTGAQIRMMITEPELLVEKISTDDDPSRGAVDAPVTVVEFTDFQCPACRAIHPVLDELVKSYGNRVRFVVRDYPLRQHEQAPKAAEAANAANAQGKFFEYATLLFKNQEALDVASLKKYAAELGLDAARFNAALDGGTYAAEVQKDINEAEQYGIDSTPTIFINGVRQRDLSPEGLRAGLERALARASKSTPARPAK
ncbi:MAG TPA: thioredoxin domain-containing protein [Pyrinomonadaceae bacterium]|jgi:protein-disulfide isomerase|nr:thioredoxin domain-containing protein [Pyrinomonadaceae bacterium]